MAETLTFTTRAYGRYYYDVEFNRAPSDNVIAALRELGYKYVRAAHCWRGSVRRKDDVLMICALAAERSRRAQTVKRDTLCWTCARAAEGTASECPWAAEFRPVPGWTAEPTRIQMWSSDNGEHNTPHITESYCVIQCPLYRAERPRKRPGRGPTRKEGERTND